MKVVFDKEKQRVPIKIWSDFVEPQALAQLENISTLIDGVFTWHTDTKITALIQATPANARSARVD